MATEQDKLTFYLPHDEAEALRQRAKDEDRTVTATLRKLVRQYLAASGATPPPV